MGDGRVGDRQLSSPGGAAVALFLDRDGVLNEPVLDPHSGRPESPLRVADVVLAAGAASAVRRATEAGLLTIIVSNQPSAAKGRVTVAEIHAVHARVVELLASQGAQIDDSYLCLHHPNGTVQELTRVCDCRKPAPGLLRQAAADHQLDLSRSWMIGDTDADLGAARAAGIGGVVIVANPLSAHRRSAVSDQADAVVTLLEAAIDTVLAALHLNDGRRVTGTPPVS